MKKRIISMILSIIMIIGLLPSSAFAAEVDNLRNFTKRNTYTNDTFDDVQKDDWFYENVKSVYEHGLMQGKGGKRFGKGEDRTPRYDNKDRKTKDASTKGPKSGKKENNHKGWNENRTPFPKTLRFHLRHPLFTPDCPLHQVSGNVAKSNRQRQKKHLGVYHGSIAIKHMVYNQITKSRN